jgi:hypothetical protein
VITVYILAGLAGGALGLLVWAIATLAPAGPARPVRHQGKHTSGLLMRESTRRLNPPPPPNWAQLPPLPDDPTQNLARPPD